MDGKDIARFEQTATENNLTNQTEAVLAQLRRYTETGQPFIYHFYPEELFDTFLKITGLETVDGGQILATHYINDSASTSQTQQPVFYAGEWNIHALLSHIADRFASVEFVNNFKAGMLLKFDDTTTVALSFELDEQPGICNNCYADHEYMELNGSYNCGHGVLDSFDRRYWAIACNSADVADAESIDWYFGALE